MGYSSDISIWFMVGLGLSNSLMWPAIWPLALSGLGRLTKMGGSIFIMSLCGSAILPVVYGYLADHYIAHYANWILLPCNGYLVYHAYYGYRIKNWSFKKMRVLEGN